MPHTWMGDRPTRRIASTTSGVSASPPMSGRAQEERSPPPRSCSSTSARTITGTANIIETR